MSSDRASIKRALEAAGDTPVEAVDQRLSTLEDRLMASIAADDHKSKTVVVPFEGKRRSAAARRIVLGAVAACLLAAVVLAAGWLSANDESYVVAAATDVTVVLPDGSTRSAGAGTELPIGAEIDVRGSMVVAGITYGPGKYSVTDSGVLETDTSAIRPPLTGGGPPVEQESDVVPVTPNPNRTQRPKPVTPSTTVRRRDRLDELDRPSTSVPTSRLPMNPVEPGSNLPDRTRRDPNLIDRKRRTPTTTIPRDRTRVPPVPSQPTTSTSVPKERSRDGIQRPRNHHRQETDRHKRSTRR